MNNKENELQTNPEKELSSMTNPDGNDVESTTSASYDPELGLPQERNPTLVGRNDQKKDSPAAMHTQPSTPTGKKKVAPPCWLFALPITIGAIATAALVVGSIAFVRVSQLTLSEDSDTPTSTTPVPEGSKTLDQIIQRGKLRCGVTDIPFFAEMDTTFGVATGLDADLCRVVAAALFGHEKYEEHLEFVFILPEERFTVLTNDDDESLPKIDLLAAASTHTMDRDVWESRAGVGLTFSSPYLYDGLKFGGSPEFVSCAESFDTTSELCSQLQVCVYGKTTTEDYIKDVFPLDNIQTLESGHDNFAESLQSGLCNVIAADGLIASGALGDLDQETIAILGESQLSREPLALVTRQDDATFSDFVNWCLQALMFADEQGISQSQALDRIARTPFFGDQFENMFADAVAAVGNYGELYDRHMLSTLGPRDGSLNSINTGNSGLIFSLPFGALKNEGPGPKKGGTIQTIKTRGHLNCGITRRAGFGVFDSTDLEWEGFDVDYCKALAAALFDGSVDHIVYHVLPATERFKVEEMGDVDVLSRITTVTLERDVLEPTTMRGFTFSQPVFYDGLSFAGLPTFAECADNVSTDGICSDLRICVNDGTTTVMRTRELFPPANIVVKPTGEEALAGLVTGDCNAIAGGSHDLARASVESVGYDGEYAIGSNRFSKEPLALVTRQDDPTWSDFVYWVVTSTFYAEENGVSRFNAEEKMPITNLFGPLYTRMLINAIQAVGSHGDIYSRNVEPLVPRGGLNLLNENPFGPQQYPLPGIKLV